MVPGWRQGGAGAESARPRCVDPARRRCVDPAPRFWGAESGSLSPRRLCVPPRRCALLHAGSVVPRAGSVVPRAGPGADPSAPRGVSAWGKPGGFGCDWYICTSARADVPVASDLSGSLATIGLDRDTRAHGHGIPAHHHRPTADQHRRFVPVAQRRAWSTIVRRDGEQAWPLAVALARGRGRSGRRESLLSVLQEVRQAHSPSMRSKAAPLRGTVGTPSCVASSRTTPHCSA